MAPTRAAHEQTPIPAFLTTVGSNSAVNMYTIPKAAEEPAFPIKAKAIVRGCKSAIHCVIVKT